MDADGSMAASHAAKNAFAYDGLVLLAAYSAADLSASGMPVISIYGSEDGVPTLTGEAQTAETVRLLTAFFKSTQE